MHQESFNLTHMSPQCRAIFDHLLRGGTISTLEAMRDFGCCRLSERVRELEATGIVIDRERVKIGKKHYTRYSYHKQITKQPFASETNNVSSFSWDNHS